MNAKKLNHSQAGEIKTMADYALILEHCNGYSKQDALNAAPEGYGEELFEEMLRRNIELFRTGDIIVK